MTSNVPPPDATSIGQRCNAKSACADLEMVQRFIWQADSPKIPSSSATRENPLTLDREDEIKIGKWIARTTLWFYVPPIGQPEGDAETK